MWGVVRVVRCVCGAVRRAVCMRRCRGQGAANAMQVKDQVLNVRTRGMARNKRQLNWWNNPCQTSNVNQVVNRGQTMVEIGSPDVS